jgi:hypothetical protein
VADDAQDAAQALAFALGQGQQLEAGGIHFTDMRQVEFQHRMGAHALDQALLDLGRVIDAEVAFDGEARRAFGGGLRWLNSIRCS